MNSKPTLAAIRQSLTDASRTVALHALSLSALGTEMPADATTLMNDVDKADLIAELTALEGHLDSVRRMLYNLQRA